MMQARQIPRSASGTGSLGFTAEQALGVACDAVRAMCASLCITRVQGMQLLKILERGGNESDDNDECENTFKIPW